MIDVITPEDAAREYDLLNNPAVSVKLVLDDMLMVVRKNGKFEQYDALELTKEWFFAGNKEYFKEKYYLYYDHDVKEISYEYEESLQKLNIYFESEEKVMDFVEKVGESNVKKFMFDIWE